MALESIADQEFKDGIFDLIIYNNSSTFDTENIIVHAERLLGNRFKKIFEYPFAYPITTSTMDDVNMQIFTIDSYDFYFCHKSDFCVNNRAVQNVIDFYRNNQDAPYFVNFCKFDLRENVPLEKIKDLLKLPFSEIMEDEKACDLTEVMPEDWGVKYEYIGYRGLDGVMHSYSESARKLLDFDTFINYYTVDRLKQKGVNWYCGLQEFLALHVFHALPSGRNSEKDIIGYRF